MAVHLRPWDLPADAGRLAELQSAYSPEPISAAEVMDAESKFPPGGIRRRTVAVDAAGRIAGGGEAAYLPWKKRGWFWVAVYVDPAMIGQGIGSALFQDVEGWALAQGAVRLESYVRDHHAAALAWARRRGYAVDRHRFESTLDLGTFDAGRFAGVVEAARSGGIRFATLPGRGGEAAERQVCELYRETFADVPGMEGRQEYPDFPQWRRWALEGEDALPDCWILALDGEQPVGLSTARRLRGTGALYIQYAAVRRSHRGRNLALAMKLLGIEAARRRGAPYVRTHNDSKNAPMLAVNRKLGYQPSPGIYMLVKQV